MASQLEIVNSKATHLWDGLHGAYQVLGFDTATGEDDVLRDLVLARIIEPTSEQDSLRVLASILHAGLVGRGVAGAGWLWGVIAPGGHDCWAGVARWAGVPGPVGFLGSVGWRCVVSGEGGPKSLPGLGDGGGPAPGGVDA